MKTTSPRPHRLRVPAATLLCAAVVTGCAKAPSSGIPGRPAPVASTVRVGNTTPVEIHTEAGMGQRKFGATTAQVWKVLPAVFEQLSIPVNNRDATSLEMGNAGYQTSRVDGKRMSTYVDCGTTLGGRLADSYDVTLMVLVRLTAMSDGDTMVTTYVDATAKARSTSGNSIHCQSRGSLERIVADVTAEQLLAALGTP